MLRSPDFWRGALIRELRARYLVLPTNKGRQKKAHRGDSAGADDVGAFFARPLSWATFLLQSRDRMHSHGLPWRKHWV